MAPVSYTHLDVYKRQVMDIVIYQATILNFVLNVSVFGDAVTAVLSWPVHQNRSIKCLMALWCRDLSGEVQ